MSQKFKIRLGVILLVISTIAWLLLFTVPFYHLAAKQKAIFATTNFIIGEVLFYAGIALLGKELYQKYKLKIKEWWKKMVKW